MIRQRYFLSGMRHAYSTAQGSAWTRAAHKNGRSSTPKQVHLEQRRRSLSIAKRFQNSMTLASPACHPRSLSLQNWTYKNHLIRGLRSTRIRYNNAILRSAFPPAQATNFGKIHRPQGLLNGGETAVNVAFWRRQSRIFSACRWQRGHNSKNITMRNNK